MPTKAKPTRRKIVVAATFAPVLSVAITRLLFAAVLLITPSKTCGLRQNYTGWNPRSTLIPFYRYNVTDGLTVFACGGNGLAV
jgi:hypothetical protein